MSAENLWGELPLDQELETPAAILQDQAAVLTRLTNGLLRGRVIGGKGTERDLMYEFQIVVPALEHYSASLLQIQHDAKPYPVFIYGASEVRGWQFEGKAADGPELKKDLAEYLQSEPVRDVIRALHAQARDMAAAHDVAAEADRYLDDPDE